MEHSIADFFAQYAYSPIAVYSAIVLFMMASAFGLPLPEEVVLISAGLIGAKALHPELYPPPTADSPRVNVYLLAAVALIAVIGSDYLIYWLGRAAGPRLLKTKFLARFITPEVAEKIGRWVNKYGYWTVLIFRFTPGIRFPGHLMCGAMGLRRARFIAIDFLAAAFSVPTQVLLMSFYGEEILSKLKTYKVVALSLVAAILIFTLARRLFEHRRLGAMAAADAARSPRLN
jgi:membrane protein DedA with SNARE-associated domain